MRNPLALDPLNPLVIPEQLTLESLRTIDTALVTYQRFSNRKARDQVDWGLETVFEALPKSSVSNYGYLFDGVNDLIGPISTLGITTRITIEARIKTSQPVVGGIIAFNDGTYFAVWYGPLTTLWLHLGLLGGLWNPLSVVVPGPNFWLHVGVTYEGTTKEYFLNGVSIGTVVDATGLGAIATAYIGCRWPGISHFTGQMDEIKVYNNVQPAARFQLSQLREKTRHY